MPFTSTNDGVTGAGRRPFERNGCLPARPCYFEPLNCARQSASANQGNAMLAWCKDPDID